MRETIAEHGAIRYDKRQEGKEFMRLYVARHGETEVNLRHQVSGRGEAQLTPRGRTQALALAERAAVEPIDLIIASPLRRAWETAQAVTERKRVPLLVEPRLQELDYGRFDQVDIDDPDFLQVKRSFTRRMGGGESILQVTGRIYPLLEELRRRYEGKNLLLVCHGTVCRVIHSYFYDLTEQEFWDSIPDNCALRRYEW